MIEIKATVESLQQAEELLKAGVDHLYFGEDRFGLRLPTSFSREEQRRLVELAHSYHKKATIAINAIMHPEKMLDIPEYLDFLVEIKADCIVVGDPGVIYTIQKNELPLPFVYGGEMLVTSARQINFWGKKGASGAVIAHEVPYLELVELLPQLDIYAEMQVYGATCIHQSKRPLLQNYMNYIESNEIIDKERMLYLSEPSDEATHYSIYEDLNGTHIFANNDINLIKELKEIQELRVKVWKLDGIYSSGKNFVEIAKRFVKAKEKIEADEWSAELAEVLNEEICYYHPNERGLGTG